MFDPDCASLQSKVFLGPFPSALFLPSAKAGRGGALLVGAIERGYRADSTIAHPVVFYTTSIDNDISLLRLCGRQGA